MPNPPAVRAARRRLLVLPLAAVITLLSATIASAATTVTNPTPDIECPEAYGDGLLTTYSTTVNTPADSTDWYVEIKFTLTRDNDAAARCQITLSTYEQVNGPPPEFPQYRHDWAGGFFGAGTHTIRVDLVREGQLAGCWSQFDFVFGPSIETLNAGGYGARQIRARIVGSDTCGTPPQEEPRGSEGCTPGYWKNHSSAWLATAYRTNHTLESVFDLPNSLGYDNTSLAAALKFGGGPGVQGGARILLRAAVASLLNSAHPDVDFSMTTPEVIAQVNAALASGNRSTMLSLATRLDRANNGGCPLN